MYPNLEAELKRRNLKRSDLAKCIGCTPSTVSLKMLNKGDFTFSEIMKIKKWLGVNMPLEELFASNDDDQKTA